MNFGLFAGGVADGALSTYKDLQEQKRANLESGDKHSAALVTQDQLRKAAQISAQGAGAGGQTGGANGMGATAASTASVPPVGAPVGSNSTDSQPVTAWIQAVHGGDPAAYNGLTAAQINAMPPFNQPATKIPTYSAWAGSDTGAKSSAIPSDTSMMG